VVLYIIGTICPMTIV